MPKLNDTQTILLSAAARRDNLSLYPLPDTLAGGSERVAKAIAGLTGGGWTEERETSDASAVARIDGDLRYGIFITVGGLAAIGIEPPIISADTPAVQPAPPESRTTKSALVLGLLEREHGASLPDLIAATGWLPHTTRAALTGLRKKGHAIARFKRDEITCYRIAAAA